MSENEEIIVRKTDPVPLIASMVVTVAMALVLWGQGRIWWCKSGDLAIYINQAWGSSHTSQHLFDPYSFTHILHGVLFFWITGLFLSRLNGGWRFFMAMLAESAWEVLENSSFIIEKYRENTASLDYFGDSILNSVGDVLACAAGFSIAYKVGRWRSLVFFILVEVALLVWIRDSFLLNIVMLIYPLDSIKHWQMAV